MRKSITDGGAAFPSKSNQIPVYGTNGERIGTAKTFEELHEGMSLRDYFAAKAMQSWIIKWPSDDWDNIARQAYAAADCMIYQRKAK